MKCTFILFFFFFSFSFFFFQETGLTIHEIVSNELAGNVKSCFLRKIRKISSIRRLLNII